MNQSFVVGGITIVLALAIVGAFGSGLMGTRERIEQDEPLTLPDPPADGSSGVIVGMQTEPHSTLGFRWGRKSQSVFVQIVVRTQCVGILDGILDSTETADCPDILTTGVQSGEGRTVTGDRLVRMELSVSRDCFDAVVVGDPWPPKPAECAP